MIKTNEDEENNTKKKFINNDDITTLLEKYEIIFEYKELDLSN